jgi:MoxR-like ATPase
MTEPKPDSDVPRSCLTCKNFVPEHEVPKRYGKAVGTAMCAKFDKPIGRSTTREPSAFKFVADKVARNCKGYSATARTANDRPDRTYRVAFPDMNMNENGAGDDRVNTCFSCKHFAASEVVMGEWGWMTGACGLKGELVPEGSTTFVGRNCNVSEFGPSRTTMLGITLLPEYDEDFLTPDLVGAFLASGGGFDPHGYVTDKPITKSDEEAGIRAWKKVPDQSRPDVDTGVFLPIYDLDRYDDKTRAKVPQGGDDEHPEDYLDHGNFIYKLSVLWTELDETPLLSGPPGVGKTELGRHLAWVMQLPFERISITASTELDDLAGKMHFDSDKGTYFQYGRVPAAWQRPGIILLDEPNVGQPDVWQFLRPLTDNSKQLVLDMNEGERIARNVDAYLLMAMNPAWDPLNVGTAPIGDADVSRLMHIFMDLPPESIEEQIVTTRCKHDGYEITRKMLKTIMQINKELRGLCEQGTLPMSWGIRNSVKVARATRWFSILDAFKVGVADFLEPQQAEIILDVVKANAPTPSTAAAGFAAGGLVGKPW